LGVYRRSLKEKQIEGLRWKFGGLDAKIKEEREKNGKKRLSSSN
jgi:hypothetical protein